MLKKEIIDEPNSVEKYFCEPFHEIVLSRPERMSDKNTVLMYSLFAKPSVPDHLLEKVREESLIFKVTESGFLALKMEVDPKLLLFFSVLCGSPGDVVMYAAYLRFWCTKNNVKKLDLDTVAETIFPYGFVSAEDLRRLWDGQKVEEGGNLLDHGECYRSIMK